MSAMVYKYMIASRVIAFKRFFMMIFGVLAGKFFFSEKNVVRKLSISVLVGVGLFVMNFDLLSSIYANTFHKQESLHAAAEVFPTDRMLDFEGDLCREEDKV
jgi:ACR3 family arsenite efflux pump ArsB